MSTKFCAVPSWPIACREPTKYELVINLILPRRSASLCRPTLLALADEVIE